MLFICYSTNKKISFFLPKQVLIRAWYFLFALLSLPVTVLRYSADVWTSLSTTAGRRNYRSYSLQSCMYGGVWQLFYFRRPGKKRLDRNVCIMHHKHLELGITRSDLIRFILFALRFILSAIQ